MDDDIYNAAAGLLFLTTALLIINRRKRRYDGSTRRWWVHPINEVRDKEGCWTLLMESFRSEYPDKHKQCLRMSKEDFEIILSYVKATIEKRDTQLRKSISAEQRLCVALFYLATGDSFRTLSLFFRMGESTIRAIIYETCQAIWDTMAQKYLKTPDSSADWKTIASEFQHVWNFPHCVGAVDGKHCPLQAPPNSGSEFFNYKKHFSLVLMAMCDAHYKFTYVDVGTPGRWSDGGTFDNCTLNQSLSDGRLNLPADERLPGSESLAPYTLVADEAFPLKTWLMRPLPGRSLDTLPKKVYNYRLSRARRTIENAFGIMVARWRCLRKPLVMLPRHATSVVLACCVLHNFLRQKGCANYCPPGLADAIDANGRMVDGRWRNEVGDVMRGIAGTAHRNPPVAATTVRDTFIHYFSNEGALPWQVQYVNRV